MMKARNCLVVVFLLLLSSFSIDAKSWRGIEPLHSTRADVERLLGSKVIRCNALSCIYDLGEETVFIFYSAEPACKAEDRATTWKVPAGTVLEIGIHFKQDRPLSELKFDLSKFQQFKDEELGWIYYVNLEEGIRIEAGLEIATGITYFQSAKDNYLSCIPTKKEAEQLRNDQTATNGVLLWK